MPTPASPLDADLVSRPLQGSPSAVQMAARRLLAGLGARPRALLAALVAFTLLGGLVYSVLVGGSFRFVDERSYYELAQGLARDGRFAANGGRTAFWPPGWPLLLSLFARLGLGAQALHLVNFGLLAGSLLLLWALGRRSGSEATGVLAATLALAYPIVFFTAGTFYPQTLCGFLLLLAVLLLSRREATGPIRAGLAGGVFGFLGLTAPVLVVMLAVSLAWMTRPAWRRAGSASSAGRAGSASGAGRAGSGAVCMVLVAAAVLGLWTARNYRVFGRFVPVSTNSGFNLLLGNAEGARANSGINVDISQDLEAAEGLDEVDTDRFLRARAVSQMARRPGHAVLLYLAKFGNYFASQDELATPTPMSRLRQPLILLTYGPLLALFAVRLASWRRLRPTGIESLLVSLYLTGGAAHALFFTRVRFRVPMDLLLCLLVALFVHRLASHEDEPAGRAA